MSLQQLAKIGYSGRTWYADTHKFFQVLCRDKGWQLEEFVHLVAITSQRAHLKKNLRQAMLLMQGKRVKLLPATKKALIHYRKTGRIHGLKTSAFARALLQDQEAVVIDVWMQRACNVSFLPNTPRRYALLANKILRAARRAGIPPAQFQAAVWCGILKKEGRKSVTYQEVYQTL